MSLKRSVQWSSPGYTVNGSRWSFPRDDGGAWGYGPAAESPTLGEPLHRYSLGLRGRTAVQNRGPVLFILRRPTRLRFWRPYPEGGYFTQGSGHEEAGRCCAFAQHWGYARLGIACLTSSYAPRAKDAGDPECITTMLAMAQAADLVVCAWGGLANREERWRAQSVVHVLREENVALHVLGWTSPRRRRVMPFYVEQNEPAHVLSRVPGPGGARIRRWEPGDELPLERRRAMRGSSDEERPTVA